MAYSNYRSDWNRERQFVNRDDDDSRRARESMERDQYGSERGGYRGRSEQDEQGGRFSEGGYGRGRESRDREYMGRQSGGQGRSHYGNEHGGWEGREDEQWRNRDLHGQYDRDANYGGFSSSGTGNYGGYGGSQGDYNYRGYGQGQRFSQGQDSYRQSGYGQESYSGSGRPSGGRAYGDYGGTASGYAGDDFGSQGQRRAASQWGGQEQDYGEHRGRGPRGYKRSDERIREDVCDCLTDDDRLDASNIDVAVKDGEVTLSGSVMSRDDKRWAETLSERISGVKEVQNSLRVTERQRSQSGQQAGSGVTAGGRDKGKESSIQH